MFETGLPLSGDVFLECMANREAARKAAAKKQAAEEREAKQAKATQDFEKPPKSTKP